jgi:protein ImuA
MEALPELENLKAKVRAIEGGGVDFGRETATLGDGIDAGLPWGGLPYRALHEISGNVASGAAAAIAGRFLDRGGVLVWCRSERLARELGEPYGPGLAGFGLDPDRVIVARCEDDREVLWAFEEALRCPGVACAIAEPRRLDLLASRRLQLAAESGGGAGLLLRPGAPDPAPNAALTRWRAEPLPGEASWRLILWRCRGGAPGVWTVRWNDQTLSFAVADGLADRADAPRRPASRTAVSAG